MITRSKIGDNFRATVTSLALQVHTGLRPTDASPGAVAAPTPHVPASTPPVLNRSLTPSDADAVSTPNPLLPASSVIGLSTPASLPSSLVPPSPNPEFAAFLSSIKLSRPIGNVTLPRLRVRGIVNTGNISFANAVLQLLVHSPPLWNLFSELGDLKRRGAGAPETSGGATPLVDATARFFKEYMFEKKEAHPQQQLPTSRNRKAEGGRGGEERKQGCGFD
jgi:ubiquitin carboxyl-terminal hydrolase 10